MAKGVSIHIGLNQVDPAHYAGWLGLLNACEADAADMADIAARNGFSTRILLTASAQRDTVIRHIRAAAGALSAGDIFFLTYSGHGGQLPDFDGDEADLQDETWCLYDGQLIDDELKHLWPEFHAGVRILVVSDSCHSGTVTRAAYDTYVASGVLNRSVSRTESGPVFRAMPGDAALKTYRAHRDSYKAIAEMLPKGKPQIRAAVRLMAGCQDNQLSMDGTFNGAFTGTLLSVWADGSFSGDYTEFHEAILRRMPPTQSPNHFRIGVIDVDYDGQQPFTI